MKRYLFSALMLLCVSLTGWAQPVDLRPVVARIKPSVVLLGSYQALGSPRFVLRGTGFVVGTGDQARSNLVVTNVHVVAATTTPDNDPHALVVQIGGADHPWEMRHADVLALDREHDLALLRFEGIAAPALHVRDSVDVQEGQAVAFTGFPLGNALGFSPVTHRGIISSIAPAALPMATSQQLSSATVRGLRQGSFDVFQIDGTAYPGNSGGPLFDVQNGDVLGVVNMVLLRGTRESPLSMPSGISYAIPSRYVLQLLQAQSSQAPAAPH
jgi:S1-C subfamily serine protease